MRKGGRERRKERRGQEAKRRRERNIYKKRVKEERKQTLSTLEFCEGGSREREEEKGLRREEMEGSNVKKGEKHL